MDKHLLDNGFIEYECVCVCALENESKIGIEDHQWGYFEHFFFHFTHRLDPIREYNIQPIWDFLEGKNDPIAKVFQIKVSPLLASEEDKLWQQFDALQFVC